MFNDRKKIPSLLVRVLIFIYLLFLRDIRLYKE